MIFSLVLDVVLWLLPFVEGVTQELIFLVKARQCFGLESQYGASLFGLPSCIATRRHFCGGGGVVL